MEFWSEYSYLVFFEFSICTFADGEKRILSEKQLNSAKVIIQLLYLAFPKRPISDKNEVMLRTILPGTMSDGMYTDSAPKMLSKKLGM